MHRHPVTLAALGLPAACAGVHAAPRTPPPPAAAPVAEPPPPAEAPRPPEPAAAPCDLAGYPPLTDYSDVREGARFSLLLERDAGGVWRPAVRLQMPHHHASALVFEPPVDAVMGDALRASAPSRVVVLATGLGRRSIEHVPPRRAWFATYAARPDRVCGE